MSNSSAGAALGLGDGLAISRTESTVSMESVTTSDGREGRKRTVCSPVLSSSSESSKEGEKRPQSRPALNPENVDKFTTEARERRAEKARAAQLQKDYRIICDLTAKASSNSRRPT